MEHKNSGAFYSVFREDILSLRLRPGMMFSTKEVCELYQTGRSPVREALIRLEQEGLIVFLPQKGTMVSKISCKRVSDERFLRISLEEHVMEEFMACVTPDSIRYLKHCIEKQKECYETSDIRGFFAWDDAFHKVFYMYSGRNFCYRIAESQAGHYHRIRLLSITDHGINQEIIGEHEAMVEELCSGNGQNVKELLKVHLTHVDAQEEKLAERFPELFECESKSMGQSEHSGMTVGAESSERSFVSELQHDFLGSLQALSPVYGC